MRYSELANLSDQDLNEKLAELKEELLNLRFQHTINQLENPMRISHVRKDIARVKTRIREREITASKQ